MAQKPLDILRKGFHKLSLKIKQKRDSLTAKLSQNESISQADEDWLDHEGNTIEELCVLETLENASDYEQEIGQLDNNGKEIVKKLREWAGNLPAKIEKKRKRGNF